MYHILIQVILVPRTTLVSPLPDCVDDVSSVERDVDSLTVVVSEVVVSGPAVYRR